MPGVRWVCKSRSVVTPTGSIRSSPHGWAAPVARLNRADNPPAGGLTFPAPASHPQGRDGPEGQGTDWTGGNRLGNGQDRSAPGQAKAAPFPIVPARASPC